MIFRINNFPFFSIFFVILLIFSLILVPKFGASIDELAQRSHRLTNTKFVFDFFGLTNLVPDTAKNMDHLHEYRLKYYGVAVQSPLVLLEFFSVDYTSSLYWYVSHYYYHLIFLLSVFCFYKLLQNLDFNPVVNFLVTVVYALNPRIYAHSFMNVKDLMFLSLLTITTFLFVLFFKTSKIKYLILFAIALAISINSRAMGVLFLPFLFPVLLHYSKYRLKGFLKTSSIFIIAFCITTLMIWPVLWGNPLVRFTEMFGTFSNYQGWSDTNVFIGKIIDGTNPPFYYIPVWIVVSVPIGYLFFWISGVIFAPIFIFKSQYLKHDFVKMMVYLFGLYTISISLFAIVFFNSTLYSDWRHLYYLHFPFTLLSAFFLDFWYKKNIKIYLFFLWVLIISIVHTSLWMIRNSPHFHVYFNEFVGSNRDQWDRDTMRVSAKQALELALQKDTSQYLIFHWKSDLVHNTWLLKQSDRDRIKIVESIDDATYILLDYRNVIGDYTTDDHPADFVEFSTIYVESIPIMSVFRRNNEVKRI